MTTPSRPSPSEALAQAATSKPVISAPSWTNPNIGMIALICGAWHRYGDDAILTAKQSLYRLGLKTGAYMIEQGVARRDCSPTEWALVTRQLLDLTGFHDHELLVSEPARAVLRVTSCPYLEPYRYLDAPRDICDVPWSWDRGCLATINPRIHVVKLSCIWWGDAECRYEYRLEDEPWVYPEATPAS